MYKKILITFIACWLSVSGISAQTNQLKDSLYSVYKEAPSDSLRLEALFDLIHAHDLDEIDTALQLAYTARDIAIEQGDSLSLADAMLTIATFKAVLGDYKEALRCDLEALRIYRRFNLVTAEARTLNSIGEDYYEMGLYNQAFEYYQQSLKKALVSHHGLMEAVATYNIGRVLKAMGQLDRARDYIESSMRRSASVSDEVGLAYSRHDLGEIFLIENKPEKALEQLKAALELSLRLEEEILTPQIRTRMGEAYTQLGEYYNAIAQYDEAFDLYSAYNNKKGIAETYSGKGEVRIMMGDYTIAQDHITTSMSIAKDVGDHEQLIKGYEQLSRLYEKRGDLRPALAFYKRYKALEDSVFSERKKEQFAQMQVQYETAKKDIEIELLNQREQQQQSQLENEELIRNILVVILAFTAVLLITLHRGSTKRKKINELLVVQQRELERQRKELAGLLNMKDKFFSILSHDLRSPIQALVGILDMLGEGNLTQDELMALTRSLRLRLDNTSKLLDNLLDWAMLQMNEIKIQKEKINLKYVTDENLLFFKEVTDKEISFINNVQEDEEVMADRNMLDLVLRNLVANSIKFTESGGFVEILTDKGPNNQLIVMVKDNGVGMSNEQLSKIFDTSELYTTKGTANEQGTGLGLKLCKEFIERMGGNIWVESQEGEGTIFKFTIDQA